MAVLSPMVGDDAITALVRCFGESSAFAEGLDACLDALWDRTVFDAMALFRLSADGRDLELVSSRGFSDRALRAGEQLPVDCSLTGIAVRTRHIVSSQAVADDDRIHPTVRAEMQRLENKMIISVPLILYQRPVGAINLVWNDRHELSPAEQSCLLQLGYIMGVAMEHTQRERESRHDGLTGLLNRREFDRLVREQAARCDRYASTVSLLMLDLDDFKQQNDTHGHAVGDEILKGLARLLGDRLRATDFCCRVGGEEFACLLPETDLEAARLVAEDLLLSLRALRFRGRDDEAIRCRASIGVCEYAGDGPEEFVCRADNLLYAAKEAGRDRVMGAAEAADDTEVAGKEGGGGH